MLGPAFDASQISDQRSPTSSLPPPRCGWHCCSEIAGLPPRGPSFACDWYKSRKLTETAAKRFAFKSCCDGSDKVETQFRVDRTTGDYQTDGQWIEVPPDVIWWDEHSPTGEAILFACLRWTASRPVSSHREVGCEGRPSSRHHGALEVLASIPIPLRVKASGQQRRRIWAEAGL
jgi:hypothetical protein